MLCVPPTATTCTHRPARRPWRGWVVAAAAGLGLALGPVSPARAAAPASAEEQAYARIAALAGLTGGVTLSVSARLAGSDAGATAPWRRTPDAVELVLPGVWYSPAHALPEHPAAPRSAEEAVALWYSAWRAQDTDWLLHLTLPAERNDLSNLLLDKAFCRQQQAAAQQAQQAQLLGVVQHGQYLHVLIRLDATPASSVVLTYALLGDRWLRSFTATSTPVYHQLLLALVAGQVAPAPGPLPSPKDVPDDAKPAKATATKADAKADAAKEPPAAPGK